jgi:RNA polymerase sigma-70 factor (ECF subfamily)
VIDETEIATLYRRYGAALYRRCLNLVSNPSDAEELMQEVFLQFLRGRDRFEGRSSVFTFLYRIATNLSIDKLRRRRTAGDQRAFDEERRGDEGRGNPQRSAAAAEELAVLTKGLADDVLETAVLAHVDGLTQDEIAAATSVSRRTVGKRLKRFLQHARRQARLAGHDLPALTPTGGSHGEPA